MMMDKNTDITSGIKHYIEEFTEMDIDGIAVNCPYWMNKIDAGKVKIRGFLNGKGAAYQIRQELIKRLHLLSSYKTILLTAQFIQKFAKRERIGVDCSGFVFQVLDKLTHFRYQNCTAKNLAQIITSGIRRTNANTLTSLNYCLPVKNVSESRLGDLIRMMGGKHVAIILQTTPAFLVYAHSARTTKIQGVHFGTIRIISKNATLDKQKWLEQTKTGENFGKKHFNPLRRDGIFRLKIFT